MTTALVEKQVLLERLDGLRQIPTIPAVLTPLLRYLQQPVEQIDLHEITDFLARDKSLAAQCLHMANSPLFGSGRWGKVESLRGAVVSLGVHHISDIAMSCGVLNLLPAGKTSLDPTVFWEHSLGCALVCRRLARKINLCDPGKAYLAGLLHDLGIIVNLGFCPRNSAWLSGLPKPKAFPCMKLSKDRLGLRTAIADICLQKIGALLPT